MHGALPHQILIRSIVCKRQGERHVSAMTLQCTLVLLRNRACQGPDMLRNGHSGSRNTWRMKQLATHHQHDHPFVPQTDACLARSRRDRYHAAVMQAEIRKIVSAAHPAGSDVLDTSGRWSRD